MKKISHIAEELRQWLHDCDGAYTLDEQDDGTLFFEGCVDLRQLAHFVRDVILESPCTHEDYGWRVHAGSFEGDGPLYATYSCEACLPATVGWAQFNTNIQAEVVQTEVDHRFVTKEDSGE